MLITNHVLIGALIGALSLVRGPGLPLRARLAAPLRCHHPQGLLDRTRRRRPIGATTMGVAANALKDRRSRAVAGMLGACLPDADKPGWEFFGRSTFPSCVEKFHGAIQDESLPGWARSSSPASSPQPRSSAPCAAASRSRSPRAAAVAGRPRHERELVRLLTAAPGPHRQEHVASTGSATCAYGGWEGPFTINAGNRARRDPNPCQSLFSSHLRQRAAPTKGVWSGRAPGEKDSGEAAPSDRTQGSAGRG